MAQREVLAGAVLDQLRRAAEETIPETTRLHDAAEQEIANAAALIRSGADLALVLRTLYALARTDGMVAMAKVGH